MEPIITALNWREATKTFDPEQKLTPEQIDTLTEAARLAPSSFGLQPWSFIVVEDPELRKELRAASWDQPQVTDASHLIVFAAKTPDDTLVDEYIADISETRGVSKDDLAGFSKMLKDTLAGMDNEARLAWAKKQAYIALGVTISAASLMHIDTGPMEGFDAAKYDEILGLKELGLSTTVILAVGFRTEDSGMKKVRFPKEKLVIKK